MGRKRTIPLHLRDKKSISVTYSKRRKTLFTKAAETALQYQIPIAVLVSSAGHRQRSKFCGFGNPSVDDVLNSYLGCGSKGAMKVDDRANALWEEVNELEVEVKNMRDREKKGEGSDGGDDQWWLRDIESMGLDELCEFANRLEKLKEDVRVRLESDSNTGDFSGMADDGDAKNENMEEVMDWLDFSGMVDDGDAKNENTEEFMDWIDFSGMVDDGDAKNENTEEVMDWYWKRLLP